MRVLNMNLIARRIEELIKLMVILVGQQVSILNDDGCNTNVISSDFLNKNRLILKVEEISANVNHSSNEVAEEGNEMVIDAEVEIGTHKYSSN